jgi:uncharacterized protein (TIRG00374 family)
LVVSRTTRLILLIIGATLVGLMIWKTGPGVILAGLRSSAWVVAVLIPLWTLVYILNAVAWRMLTSSGGKPLPLLQAFRMTLIAFAVNYATPLMSFGGEPLKVVAATPWLGHRRAVGSVVAFRLLHALAHVIGFLVALIPAYLLLPHTPLVITILVITAIIQILLMVFLLSRHREGMAIHLLHLVRKIPFLRKPALKLEAKTPALHEIDEHLTAVYTRDPRRFYWALAVETLARFLSLSEHWIILYGLGLGTDVGRALVIGSFSSLVINALSFLPLELGSKEGGLYLIFKWMGLSAGLGLQASLLGRIREIITIGIGMGLIWTVRDVPTSPALSTPLSPPHDRDPPPA